MAARTNHGRWYKETCVPVALSRRRPRVLTAPSHAESAVAVARYADLDTNICGRLFEVALSRMLCGAI